MDIIEKGRCPFKKLNNRLQQQTKSSIAEVLKQKQTDKHREYLAILRRSFEHHRDYYLHIHQHISLEDKKQFTQIDNHQARIEFINTKLKEYFWRGIVFYDADHMTSRELSLQQIGNLGLDDVTTILHTLLSQEDMTADSVISTLDQEMRLRLKNNVLIDAILHLPEFPDSLITRDTEKSAQSVLDILQHNFKPETQRFAQAIVPAEFISPMQADGMIEQGEVIPQLTFGCPIVNLQNGEVFRAFVSEFIRCFLSDNICKNPWWGV